MDIIQMVLKLIRATRKTTLNCMSVVSVCLVPDGHCTRSHQLHTKCITLINLSDTHRRCKELLEQNGFSVSPIIGSLLNKCF